MRTSNDFAIRRTCVLICLSCFPWLLKIWSQNLVRDGSFENIECPDNPINSVSNTPTWYAINTDVYYISDLCPFDQQAAQAVNALNQPIRAQDGLGFMSLEAGLTTNGFFTSEGIGIELTQPLERGHFYYLDFQSVHYPPVPDIDYPAEGCDPMPSRYISVYFSDDKIEITPVSYFTLSGYVITGFSSNARQRSVDRAPDDPEFKQNQWNFYWDCFEAEGYERHLAMSGSQKKSSDTLDCFMEDMPGRLYFGGYAVDNIRLVEIPRMIDSTFFFCPGGIDIDLNDLLDGPYFDKARFVWDDGNEMTARFLSDPGIYQVEMILPCVVVPVTLRIVEIDCTPDIFVANAFTPNGDGINDVLFPAVVSPLELTQFRFVIYNRWGQRIYSTDSPVEGWDGLVNGQPAMIGVYTWTMEYILDDIDSPLHRLAGDVLLSR